MCLRVCESGASVNIGKILAFRWPYPYRTLEHGLFGCKFGCKRGASECKRAIEERESSILTGTRRSPGWPGSEGVGPFPS